MFPLRFNPNEISQPQLITIRFSHYCEIARWALDFSGIGYNEVAYAVGCHFDPVGTLRASKDRRAASSYPGTETNQHDGRLKFGVPLVCLKEGEILKDSWEVLKHYVGDPSADWIKKFDTMLGPSVRRVMYCEILRPENERIFINLFQDSTELENSFLATEKQSIAAGIKAMMNISDTTLYKDRQTLDSLFCEYDLFLDGIPDISAHRDTNPGWWIAVSSLTGILLAAPSYGGHSFSPSTLSEYTESHQEWVAGLRDTKIGRNILSFYRTHRAKKIDA